ncbi:MAG: hypothetical protein OEZ41_09920 [Nitrospirota bacterium]|nr:hypothetical protein [Nitrospirota bacterium]
MQTIFIRLFIVLALIVHQGCSHTTGPILSESIQGDMQRIGVVVKEEQEESLQNSRRGWLSSMGQGAGRGSIVGAGGAIICGPMFIVCLPFLSAAGAVGGSVYGVYQGSSETLPTEIESQLGKAITEASLIDLLVTNLVADGQAWGYPMEAGKNAPLATGQNQVDQRPALQEPLDTLLEIEGPAVNLLPTSYEGDPPRRVGLSARVRVIRTADQEVLEDRIILEEFGDSHNLEEWTANQAQHFQEELPRATRRLSEKILIDFFMRYAFKERTYDNFGIASIFMTYRLRGLDSPNTRKHQEFTPIRVGSLRPTGRWEAFPGENVTYDLRILESKEYPTAITSMPTVVGEVIYEREGLTENVHTLEEALEPDTVYTWSVRARFLKDGKVRVTEWSKYKIGFTVLGKILSLGFGALAESMEEWRFYQFHTPPNGDGS